MPNKKTMKLRSKINLLVLLNIMFVLLLVMSALSYIIVDKKFNETGDRALILARTVAGLPQVVQAFNGPDPSAMLQPLAEQLRKANQCRIHCYCQCRLDPLQSSKPG